VASVVLLDEHGRVGLLLAARNGYHRLPGGVVEPGGVQQQALERELLAQVGCQCIVLGEAVGVIVDVWRAYDELEWSTCLLARCQGELVAPQLTGDERAEGFRTEWADDLDAAIRLVAGDAPNSYDGRLSQARDLAFLLAAGARLAA
jgi:ADP-ribose pyrophosphatase YjhB (NUDIX family)